MSTSIDLYHKLQFKLINTKFTPFINRILYHKPYTLTMNSKHFINPISYLNISQIPNISQFHNLGFWSWFSTIRPWLITLLSWKGGSCNLSLFFHCELYDHLWMRGSNTFTHRLEDARYSLVPQFLN